MAFGLEEVVSLAMLGCSLFLIVNFGQRALGKPLLCFFAAMLAYLCFGILTYDPQMSSIAPSALARAYLASICIVWAIAGFIASIKSKRELDQLLSIVSACFLVSAISVWLSPVLYNLYAVLPPSDPSRFGGFFGNPNEAAICGLIAFTLAVNIPKKNPAWRWFAIIASAGAVCLTYSKTGICILILLIAWSIMRDASRKSVEFVPIIASVLALLVFFLPDITQSIADNPQLELTQNQRNRILDVGEILEGKISAETSTGRTDLWEAGLMRALDTFPVPHGLGSYHNLVGGELNGEREWFGVHNTFLMVFGEAGPVALILLIASVVVIGLSASQSLFRQFSLPLGLILVVDMMVNHNALIHRYFDLCLGLIIGLACLRLKKSHNRRRDEI